MRFHLVSPCWDEVCDAGFTLEKIAMAQHSKEHREMIPKQVLLISKRCPVNRELLYNRLAERNIYRHYSRFWQEEQGDKLDHPRRGG